MQTRKLQQVGGGTYTVSIPKEWADENALEAGMELNLYTHTDGSIVVRASERDGGDLAQVRVLVDGSRPALVARVLENAHAVGFETVTLVPTDAFTDAQRRAARSVVRGLVGTDLVVATDEEITVRHLLDASTVSVRQSVVQLQFMALSVHREGTVAAVEGDESAADRLADRRAETDRLARMVARHFARSLRSFEEIDRLGVSRSTLFDYHVAARELARVADLGVRAARVGERSVAPLPDEVASEVTETAERARKVVDDATTALLDEPGSSGDGSASNVDGSGPAGARTGSPGEEAGSADDGGGPVDDRTGSADDGSRRAGGGSVGAGGGSVGDGLATHVDRSGARLAHDALDLCDETVATVDAIQTALLTDGREGRGGVDDGSDDGAGDSSNDGSEAPGLQLADRPAATGVAASRLLDTLGRTADAGGTVADVALRAATRADGV